MNIVKYNVEILDICRLKRIKFNYYLKMLIRGLHFNGFSLMDDGQTCRSQYRSTLFLSTIFFDKHVKHEDNLIFLNCKLAPFVFKSNPLLCLWIKFLSTSIETASNSASSIQCVLANHVKLKRNEQRDNFYDRINFYVFEHPQTLVLVRTHISYLALWPFLSPYVK